jgi:hypothetical protein
MKRLAILFALIVMTIQGCHKKTENSEISPTPVLPPPEFYEFRIDVGDGAIFLFWHFIGLRDSEFGVEVSYYLNGVKKVQTVIGDNTMTISGLTNDVPFEFTLVRLNKTGIRSEGSKYIITPHSPFLLVAPTSSDGYSIVDGKVRIDLRFNRLADTTSFDSFAYAVGCIQLRTNLGSVAFSYTWLEKGMGLSILTQKTQESFCNNYPCSLYLIIHFDWVGATMYNGLKDTNGMFLDGNKDGREMGDSQLTFILQ